VAFYAVDPSAYRELLEHLRQFRGQLPADVDVRM
jgi:hypothetical protein